MGLNWERVSSHPDYLNGTTEDRRKIADYYLENVLFKTKRLSQESQDVQARVRETFYADNGLSEPEPGLFSRAGKAIKDAMSGIAGERTWTGGTDAGEGERIIESGATGTDETEEPTAKPSISGVLGDRLAAVGRKMTAPGAGRSEEAPPLMTEAIAAPEEGQYAEGVASPAKASAKTGAVTGASMLKPAASPSGGEDDSANMDFLGGLAELGKSLARMPKNITSSVISALQGKEGPSLSNPDWGDRFVNKVEEEEQKRLREAKEKYGDKWFIPGIARVTDATELSPNLGFSVVSMGGGLLGGLTSGMVTANPVVGLGAQAIASGKLAYNMDGYQVMKQYLELQQAEKGSPLTPEEEEAHRQAFLVGANKHGLWEAIPEAVGNVGALKVISTPLKNMFGKTLARKILAKIASIYGAELTTEEVTQMGQSNVEFTHGMGGERREWTDPSAHWKSFKEVAPQVFLLSTLMGGGSAVAEKAYQKIKGTPSDDDAITYITNAVADKEHMKISDRLLDETAAAADVLRKNHPDNKDIAEAAADLMREIERRRSETGAERIINEGVDPEEKGMTPEEILTGERKPAEEAILEVEEALGDQRMKTGLILDEDEAAAQFTQEELEKIITKPEEKATTEDKEGGTLQEEGQEGGVAKPPAKEPWETGEERPFTYDPNSTKNEGRFRLAPPDSIEKDTYFRRKSSTPGVSYVMGKDRATGKETIQAVRFNKNMMTEEEAAVWYSENAEQFGRQSARAAEDVPPGKEEGIAPPISAPAAEPSPDPGWDAIDDDLRLAMAQDAGWAKKTAEKFAKTRWADLTSAAQRVIRDRFEKAKARLAGEREAEEFVTSSSSGKPALGNISEDVSRTIGRPAGEIRLTAKGLEYIKNNHAEDISRAGFPDVSGFVEAVASDFTEIRKGKGESLLLAKEGDSRENLIFIELVPDPANGFYRVNNAFPARSGYVKSKKLLWKSAQSSSGHEAPPLKRLGESSNNIVPTEEGAVKHDEPHEVGIQPGGRPLPHVPHGAPEGAVGKPEGLSGSQAELTSDKSLTPSESDVNPPSSAVPVEGEVSAAPSKKEPEAEKRPEKAPEPAPPAPTPPVEEKPKEGAATLAGHGLSIKKTATKKGSPVWEVTGDTKPHKDRLKALGGKWFGPRQTWSFYKEDPTEKILGALEGKNQETMAAPGGKPEIEKTAETDSGQAFSEVALRVSDAIAKKEQITWQSLFEWGDKAFGGTQAEGRYTPKDAYDALEIGINKYLFEKSFLTVRPNLDGIEETQNQVKALKDGILEKIPTQSKRTEEQDEFQQFSTPPPFAFLANWVANIGESDTVLEPSAGTGNLAVFAKIAGANVVLNELSKRRAALLRNLNLGTVYTENAEHLHAILPKSVKPTVVVMNPPFSSTAGRLPGRRDTSIGAEHVEQALKRLEPGGRLVAIVGKGMAPDAPAFREWWKKIRSEYKVLANVGVSGDEYRKYGTTFDNRLIVIDKTGKTDTMELTGSVDKVEDLVPLLKGVRDARNKPETGGRSEQTPAEPGGLEGAEKSEGARGESLPVRPATGGLGHGGERGQPGGPIRSIEPGASPVRGGSEGRDEVSDQAAGGGRGVRSVSPGEGGRSGGPGVGDTGSPVVQTNDRNRTEALLDIERREKAPSKEELSDSKIFDEYKPQATIKGAKPHPGKLEESAAMAAIPLPRLTYALALPEKIVDEGRLSDAQLEAVLYAGQSHKQFLPGTGGARMGFFVGDGTGVGKGREIAAIIWDNYLQGRKKAVWVSQNQPLINDAKRDVEGVGWNPGLLVDLGKAKLGSEIKNEEGIAFLGYGLLASKSKRDESISRLNQLTSWLGEDFDGVIVFDEAHNLANALTTKGSRGRKAAAQKALAGIELQARFPKARIVYVSATGATEVSNLSYCDRLGLWGYGTAFADKRDFIENIAGSGVAAMEMVAQNLKAMGRYMARSLSFDGVSYSSLEHPLNEDQRVAYDKSAEAWQIVLNNVHAAIEATKADKKQKANAMSAFWGAHQRFFNQIITSMQMPSVIKALEKDLAEGSAPVLQLVNTNEAQLNRSMQNRREEDETEDLDLTPLEQLIGYVRNTFPVQQYQEVEDEDGNVRSEPVKDSKGNPVENPKAVEMRDRLLDELESLKRFIPDGPLDMLVNHFGHENIAEVTGRTKRLITTTDEKGTRRVVEKWSKSRSMVDADAFQNDKKHILVFSQAGGTGRSYHADLTAKNQRLRKHYLVQPGWRADVAVQGFGRSHRSNQAQPPEYVLVTTDLKGQKRFISSVARRLDQLGALTKGQRQAGSQGFFGAEDNLENIHAHHGLGDLINDVYGGKVQGISIDNLEAETGLKFTDQDGNLLRNPVPPMTQFLNRILSMKIETQNRVFDLFAERMRNRIERARAEGTLDVGLETVRAKRIDKLQEVVVHTDEQSGAETKYMEFEITNDAPKLTFENSAGHAKGGYARNNRSGRVYAVSSPRFRTDPETGEVVEMVGLLGANYSGHNIPAADLNDPEKYSRIAGTEAKDLWETELNALPSEIKSRRHLVTGALLPIWDRLPANEIPRIFRLRSSDGQTHLGRLIPEKHLQRTLERIGATATAQDFAPADVYRGVYDEGKEFVLANDWRIRRRRVSGDYRIELVGPFFRHDNMLKGLGVFMERIQYATRYFIPVDPAKGVRALEGILKQSPVVNTRGGQQVAVEPSEIDRYSLRGSSPQGGNKSFAQQLDDFQAGRLGKREVLTVGETPAVLEMLGAEQRPLVMTQTAIRKDTGGRHTLPIEALKDLPLLLEDPIMVFDSATQPNSLVVVTELKHDGKTVVAAVHLSKEDGRNVVHEIASVYGKDSHTIFAKWINDGLLRYMNKKKSREWAVTAGLQLPGVRGTIQGFKKKILFEYDLVKKKNELDALRKESGIGEAETVLSEQDTKALLRILGKRVRGLTIYTNDEGVTYIRARGGKRVAVKTVRADRLKPDRAAVELYDEENRGGDIRGGYSNKTKTIYLAKGKGDFWTLTHEFYHFLEDAGVVSAMDREILTRHIRGLVKKGAFETRNKNDIGGDEDRAFFAETRLAGEPYDIKSPIGRILENIREFIDTIINALGIRTARGVMRDIRTGKIHDQAQGEEEPTGKESDIRYRMAPPAAADSALPEHVRERWEQSRGVPRRSKLDGVREMLQHAKEGTAHFPALQRIADKKLRSALSDLLRTHQEIPQYASEIAIRRLGEWTGNLAPGQRNIYEENIILADLVRDIESGLLTEGEGSWLKEGPFGFRTADEVRDAFDKAQEMAGRDPAVSEALKKRTDFIRELKQDLVDFKILKPEVLDSQDYYHHQVLIHWGDFRGAGTGSRDVRKHWRPWMAARTGSVHDYNTQYFEAEFTAIAQQLAQVETARTLARLKEMADEYDACKKKEKAENRKLFYKKWSAMHGGATVIPGDKDTDPLFQFKQKIAMAAGKLEKMAKKGELKYDSEWSDIIDRIAAGAGVGEPRFFHFLSHLMNRKGPGALQAATIFKAIQDRNKMIDKVLGKDKLAWQHFIPEGYVQWKPDPSKGWFWANTYTDAILQKIAAGEIQPEDAEARKVLAKGRAYIWVIPEGLAETLDKFNPTGALGDDAGMLARLAAKSLAAWKQYILINPVRVLKYNTNNASGDADICIAYAPEILKPKYGHKAMTDLVAWHRRQHDKLDPDTRAELEKARRLGVLGSGFAVQEVEDVMKIIPDERHLKNLLAGEKLNILQKYWQGAREFTTWRENILRLAAYRFFRDSLEKGKKLYGASNPAEIDAIADLDEKAAKLARELLGDYGNISAHGQYIRKRLIPFYSWCVPAETEILTRVGWKKKDDLMIGEEVLTYNMITRTTEWQPVEDKAEYPFDGELVTLTNAYGFKYQFTEDHRVVVIEKYKDKRKIVLAKDLKTHHHIPLVAPHVFDDQSILSEKDAGLLGWLVTDGYTRWRGNSFESMIYQAPGKKADDIRREYADYISSESIHPDSGVICFRIKAAATRSICEAFKSKDDLPRIVTRLGRSAAEAMYKTMLLGDGDSRNRFTIFTQNEGPVLDAFQILCYRLGKVGHIRPKVSSGEKQKAIYVKNGDKLQLYKWQNTREAYSGIVWCPKTPNGTWVMRQNGKVMITGNCEINAPRYVYMLRNLKHEDGADGSRRRMTAVAGRKMLAGGAKFVIRAGLLYGAVMLYNAIVWPDEEERLGEMGRQQLHLILGRREDGSIVTLRFQGALSDALAWFDGEDLPKDIADVVKGRRTLQEKLIDIPKAILNRIVQGFRPDIKVAAEVGFGQASFPDVTRPRPIYDTAEHILRTFSLDAPYRWIAGKPKRGGSTAGMLFQDIQKMLLYEADPSEQAYYDIRRMVNEWNEKRGKEPTYGGSPNRKGKALYYYKQALRYGDFKAAEKYLAKYQALGGNWKGLHQSIRMAHPLAGVKQELRYNFRKGLSEAEEATLQRALEFYRKHYLARGGGESATGR